VVKANGNVGRYFRNRFIRSRSMIAWHL
jgi:hypothetical protein